MNRTWMLERLEAFMTLCKAWDTAEQGSEEESEFASKINTELPTVQEIAKLANPELVRDITRPKSYGLSATKRAVETAIGIIRDQDEWRVNLAPDAPSLVADQFHPHVWEAAAAIWDTGSYRVAVQQAAVTLSTHIAAKAGSSLTERRLVQEVFKTDPPTAAQVRLHFPGDKSTDTWKSR
jgi:hypothetical protein